MKKIALRNPDSLTVDEAPRISGKQPVLPAGHKGADTILRKGFNNGTVFQTQDN